MHGPTCILLANLTNFLLKALAYRAIFTKRYLRLEAVMLLWLLANYVYFVLEYEAVFTSCAPHGAANVTSAPSPGA